MIPASALPYGLLITGVLGVIFGVIIAGMIERRKLRQERAEALEPFERPVEPLPPEPDQIGTFTNIRVPVNLIVERCDAVRAAEILRRETAPKSLPEAAE